MRGEEDPATPAITNDLLGHSLPMAIIFLVTARHSTFNIFLGWVLQIVTFVINLVQVVQNMRT